MLRGAAVATSSASSPLPLPAGVMGMQRKRHRCPRSSPGPAFLALGREGGNGIRTPGWRRPRGRPPPLCARSPRAVGAAGRLLRGAGLSGRAGATGVGRPPGCGGCGCGCGCGSGSGSGCRCPKKTRLSPTPLYLPQHRSRCDVSTPSARARTPLLSWTRLARTAIAQAFKYPEPQV